MDLGIGKRPGGNDADAAAARAQVEHPPRRLGQPGGHFGLEQLGNG